MRLSAAVLFFIAGSPAGLSSLFLHAAPHAERAADWGRTDSSADGDLLRVDNPKPEPATSDRARVAPGPSERKEPASPEIRQTPVGGQTEGKPAGAEQDRRHE